MPYGVLIASSPELFAIACRVAGNIPDIVAPALSLEDRDLHNGKITPKEIMIMPILGSATVNGKDLELIVVAHDFPERVENADDRQGEILKGVHGLLYGSFTNMSVGVCLILTHMSYRGFEIMHGR